MSVRQSLAALLLAVTIFAAPICWSNTATSGHQPPVKIGAAIPHLNNTQKESLVIAYRMGEHYGLGLTFAAIVLVESSACQSGTGDHGHAFGCSQIHESAVETVAGVNIPDWQLSNPALQDVNMALGARYLDLCMLRFGWPAGIDAYHEGIPRAVKIGRASLAHSPYTLAVLAAYRQLQHLPLAED